MIEHHLQREIVNKLVAAPAAHFSELKPKNVEGNVFTYHLQQLIKQKYVEKCPDGAYRLTANGKAVGININLTQHDSLRLAHAVFFIALQVPDKGWLLRQRMVHPMYGKFGFVHGEPIAGKPLVEAAEKRLTESTGLAAKLTPRGSGYVHIFQDGELESFTQFTLLYGDSAEGTLTPSTRTGLNQWVAAPDFSSSDMLPSMEPLVAHLQENHDFFFAELTYQL